MEMGYLSIGQMAKLNNISAQTLRFYEKIKLIEPIYKNEQTGYRMYDIRQSACLDMIQYLKSLDISLKEIQKLLQESDIDVIINVLRKKIIEVDRQIEGLTFTRRAIEDEVSKLREYTTIPEPGKVVHENMEERMIHSFGVKEDYYAKGHVYFEAAVRELKSTLILNKIPMSYFCNIGSIVSKNTIKKGNFRAEKIFIKADESFAKYLPVETIPPGEYLCVYFEGYLNERTYAEKLLEYVQANDLLICSDYIAEVIAEVPVFCKAERNTFIKIQICIKSRL